MRAIGRTRRSDDLIVGIEAMIESGEVEVGAELPSERELMTRFRVGRPSVREALFALEQRGRLRIRNGARARVVEPDADTIIEAVTDMVLRLLNKPGAQAHLNEARVFFEVAMVRYAAESATATDIKHMREALEANRLALGRAHVFARSDAVFHATIASIPGNPILQSVQKGFVIWMTEQRTVTFEMPEADEISYQDHVAILDAILDQDPDRAAQVMKEHLTFVTEVYQAVIKASRDAIREATRTVTQKMTDKREAPKPRRASRRHQTA